VNITLKAEHRTPTRPDVLREALMTLGTREMMFREELIRVCIQPKPRWLPERIWRALLKRMLVIESEVRR
jgi:hypothetical protein